jgi:hypothetical protein
MVEKDFQIDLCKGLRSQGAFAYKVPDLARAVVKPFDLCIAYDGRFLPTECKMKKFSRQGGFKPEDTILLKSDFRGHQLPTLEKIWESGQGYPYVAVCAAIVCEERVIKKRAWMIPIACFLDTARGYSLMDLECDTHQGRDHELVWVPAAGWTAPWMTNAKQ